jgi:hypothetical protein
VARKFNISDEVLKSNKNLLGHTFNIQKPEWFVKKNHHKKWENPPRMFNHQHVNKQGEGGVFGINQRRTDDYQFKSSMLCQNSDSWTSGKSIWAGVWPEKQTALI